MPTRRQFLKSAGTAALLAHLPWTCLLQACAQANAMPATAANDRLWYRLPARQWVDALPLGNGSLGAMDWGGTARERLQLNEDTLFAGQPYDANPAHDGEALQRIRELIFEQRFEQAEALTQSTLMSQPIRQMPYQALGDLWLDLDGLGEVSRYHRELDLDRARTWTHFRAGDVAYSREVFISPVDQCLVLRLTADRPGAISGWLSATSEQAHQITAAGRELSMEGRNGSRFGVPAGLRFHLRAAMQTRGGTVQGQQQRLRVDGVDELILRVACATSYKRYDDVSADPQAITQARLHTAQQRSFAQLQQDHEREHQRLYRRVQLDLGSSEAASRPTDYRVERSQLLDDPALATLYFNFGRYLLICSSRPGSQPANLQGIWNDLLDPPWSSKWTININTEMNYWPAQVTALAECVEPVERMIGELSETGQRSARALHAAPGWVVHHNTDLWRQTSPVDSAAYGLWPMGGAWLLQTLWDHWDYGRDHAFLRRVYPWFRSAAEFFVATLVQDPDSGEWVTNPSMSPENKHPHGTTLCAGPAMDSQILRDLFDCCIQAAGILGVDAGFAARLAELRQGLPVDRIGSAGQLQEWRQDWDMQAPDLHHRHVSHLYALHPSSQINVRDTPALAAAARRSLEIRGDEATGWGIGWRLNLWARLHDGEHAYAILKMLLDPSRTYPNLFDAHPPFQIDGNLGGTAGIAEMLLQSWGGSIFLLPALPSRWAQGSVRGLRVRGGASINMHWRQHELQQVELHSSVGGRYQLLHGGHASDWQLDAGERLLLTWQSRRLVPATAEATLRNGAGA